MLRIELIPTTVFQAQAGWSQHDYGHLSVFEDNSINHFAHRFTIGTLKVSASKGFKCLMQPNIHWFLDGEC